MLNIVYKIDVIPDIEQLVDLFNCSDYFPIKDKTDLTRIDKMFKNSNIVVTAWENRKLIGLSRAISDFSYCCYLSDLCVRDEYKKNGIGKELVMLTKQNAGDECKLILQSSPNAIIFYKNIGMENIDSAFIFQRNF
ncbi:MAG: GNAT family N-acetyltransferase [Saprospiraceae bacterium]|nr:GNAT family N-acetyltransferase [Saprospiraceae bacterium]